MNKLFIKSIELKSDEIPSLNEYPFSIDCIKQLERIDFKAAVTFFYGENGTGKSTLLEAIAIALGINAEGGSENFAFSTYDDYSQLYKYLKISKMGLPKTKFFLRAESFYNVATSIEDYGEAHNYGGNLHNCSHGESFLQLVENRFWDNGLYILDEPEAALSPSRQLTLLCHLNRLERCGCQFLIATHSPILLAYQNGVILDLNNGFEEIKYRDTEVYGLYRDFLNSPERIQNMLFEE